MSNLHAQLIHSIATRHNLPVSPAWLTTFISSTRQPPPPLPALTSTAHFRILASDITTSLSPPPHNILPADTSNVTIKERGLSGDVIVQVLDITDVGTSKWSQVEAMERVERGEEVRGREVIRNVPIMNEDGDGDADGPAARGAPAQASTGGTASGKKSAGPHTLVIQDAKGTKVTAFEVSDMAQLYIGEGGVSIGCKLLLKQDTVIRRGMVMLTPENVTVVGGKIESWDKKWREDRKKTLIAEIEALHGAASRTG